MRLAAAFVASLALGLALGAASAPAAVVALGALCAFALAAAIA